MEGESQNLLEATICKKHTKGDYFYRRTTVSVVINVVFSFLFPPFSMLQQLTVDSLFQELVNTAQVKNQSLLLLCLNGYGQEINNHVRFRTFCYTA